MIPEKGKNVLVESVTSKLYLGRLVEVIGPHTVVIEDHSWVEFTGRLGDFTRNGSAEGMAIEYCGNMKTVHWATIEEWVHKLPNKDT